ncbi:DNA-binding TFAR19-related protein [Gonapodya prolifera JEL478]|uniref:DNA-binding TFAR19-related protein n=1 Tax=Gonapodya prolifera (strain JEL478) TaxID=1344416 RepID=A0A139AN18_GONPJ|nr:DNA-binding TFAR19-related protein [Gonapodya prolifera JEL478]|eukprot:KXS18108.1 DNA-binding TFAR19-related protein [Gonapodya prolifera JEL478]
MSGIPGMQTQGSQEDAEKKAQMEEMRRTMLTQILDPQARERLGRLSLTKPDVARSVEDLLLNMARSGRIQAKLTEKELIGLLEQVSAGKKETKIVYTRRRRDSDDDEDELDL